MPQHKGKVERGVAYLRSNALKGRRFRSIAEENLFLQYWESSIADKRIHGTTRKQAAASFAEERPHLQPLPISLLPCFQEARRSVHRDSYVEVERAFHEAPPELIGREIWVRWDNPRRVRIFNERMEQVLDAYWARSRAFLAAASELGAPAFRSFLVPLLGESSGGAGPATWAMDLPSPRRARARVAALDYGALRAHQKAFPSRLECSLRQGAQKRYPSARRHSPAHW